MTPEDLGGHPILKVSYEPHASISGEANLLVRVWSEKRQMDAVLSMWITPELADDPVALRAFVLLELEDAEMEAQP